MSNHYKDIDMKTILKFILLLTFFQTSISFSATYTTIANGNWENTTSVWSLDGITSCGCSPSLLVDSDQIIVNHNITVSNNLDITQNSTLTVNSSGSLQSDFVLTFINSTGVINGNVSVKKLVIDGASVVDFNSSVLTVTSRMDIYGTVNVDGGYLLMTGGNMVINDGAVFNTTNNGKVDVQNGNISNAGEFNLCATCCFTTSGNWKNLSSGVVQGSGAATSTNGNMSNTGFWSLAVAWCSKGSASGMPGFENCLTAEAICGLVVLAVELDAYDVHLNDNGLPTITWSTLTEKNNDYFFIEKLIDNNWVSIGRVEGSGTSEQERFYQFVDDENETSGVNYYRLNQVDYDGQTEQFEVKSVEIIRNASVYPNPSNGLFNISYSGNQVNTEYKILSLDGRVLLSESHPNAEVIQIDISSEGSGVYILNINNNEIITKLVVE